MRKKKNELVIIHFQPLERFPPVLNLLNYFGDRNDNDITVISTKNRKGSALKTFAHSQLRIIRTPAIVPGSIFRIVNYIRFYLFSLLFLIIKKPDAILYFQTLSSWPALIYKKIRGKKVKLLLHCHEYTAPEDYKNMHLNEAMHNIETQMYKDKYEWISHTNEIRLAQFRKDNNLDGIENNIFHVMPNYPPVSWKRFKTNFGCSTKIRLVFVGSLGYDNMYLQETVDWVILNKAYFSLDIYSYNIDQKAFDLLKNIPDDCIKYFGGMDYDGLPQILQNYDVGLVLYKPFSYNTVIAISNKVFEYIACGLDVWFSDDMAYTLSFSRVKVYPKIIPLNFKKLNEFNFKNNLSREGLAMACDRYYCENIYENIYNVCFGKN